MSLDDYLTLNWPVFEPDVFLKVSLPAPLTQAIALSEISTQDAKWDKFRAEADYFQGLYRGTVYDRYADRMDSCGGYLKFIQKVDPTSGDTRLKLDSAKFCRVPRCPICQWRRQLMWRAKALKVMPLIFKDFPKSRFIFLTLTVKNCSVEDLRETLVCMNKAWDRLSKRRNFPAIGWLKAVEVTRSDEDDTAHPHFHCLLLVKPSYFTGNYYISHEKWTQMWQESLRVEYTPIVHVQSVKTSKSDVNQGMLNAVLETIKYSVKPSDIMKDMHRTNSGQFKTDQEWLLILTEQMYKMRSIATGGVLRQYLQQLENEPEDLIHVDEIPDDDNLVKSIAMMFYWNRYIQRYIHVNSDKSNADLI